MTLQQGPLRTRRLQQISNMIKVASTVLRNAHEVLFSNSYENLSAHWSKLDNRNSSSKKCGALEKFPQEVQLQGKICIVTGANTGIGFDTSKALALRGAHVILACRNKEKGEAAVKEISKAVQDLKHKECKGQVEFMKLDLASLQSVKTFIQSFNDRKLPLNLLICNAGIMAPPTKEISQDGLELQFQANFLGHWVLIQGLLSEQRQRRHKQAVRDGINLEQGHKKHETQAYGLVENGTRVVTLSSCTHHCGSVQWRDMQSSKHYSPFVSYTFSKLAMIITAKELQRRFDKNPGYGRDSVVSVHPGVVDTHLASGFFETQGEAWLGPLASLVLPTYNAIVAASRPLFFRTTTAAAATVLYASLAPSCDVAGCYVVPPSRVAQPDKVASDETRALQLWDYACDLSSIKLDVSLS